MDFIISKGDDLYLNFLLLMKFYKQRQGYLLHRR